MECDCKGAANYCRGHFDGICIHITFWFSIVYLGACIFAFALMVYWSVIAFLPTSVRACVATFWWGGDSALWNECFNPQTTFFLYLGKGRTLVVKYKPSSQKAWFTLTYKVGATHHERATSVSLEIGTRKCIFCKNLK